MTVTARWWCCAEYARTGAQHEEACEYALLGERADVLVQVKADYARLAHQLRGAVGTLRMIAAWPSPPDEPLTASDAKAMRTEAKAVLDRFGGSNCG